MRRPPGIDARSGTRAAAIALAITTAVIVASGCGGSTKTGKVPSFTFALNSAPASMDLAALGNVLATMQIISLVTEPIERATASGALKPNLASSVSAPNGRTLVYHIRKGVRFSNGKPLTSADVEWSLRHIASPKSKTGVNALGIQSIKALDPSTVQVKFAKPAAANRGELTFSALIQEASFAQAHRGNLGTAKALPIGTGPYKFQSWTSDGVTLVRNPHYWGKKKPPIDKLVFPTITQDTSAQLAMRSGSIQAAQVGDLSAAKAWKGVPGVTLVRSEQLDSNLLSFDTSKPPFDDVHVRKAIAYSLDRRGVLDAGLGGYGTVLQALVPPGELVNVAPSGQAVTAFLDSVPQYDYDPAKAKAELAQSGYPDGLSITMPYVTPPTWGQLVALNLEENMKPMGVTIKPQVINRQQWQAALFGHKMRGMNVLDGFAATVADPSNVVGTLVDPDLSRPVGNIANWTPPKVKQARLDLLYGRTKAVRWEATKTILTAIANDVPYVPLFSVDRVYALGKGYRFSKPLSIFDVANGEWIFKLRAT